MPDTFDRMLTALHGLPDVTRSKPTTVREVPPLIGEALTFIVQTYRQREKGDTVFVELASAAQHTRLVLPPRVVDAIVRQRDALTATTRSRLAKEQAEARKAAGIVPGFMRGGRKRK